MIYVNHLYVTERCRMTTDGSINDLHDFAKKMGILRSQFKNHRIMPHYLLTPSRYHEAIRLGAGSVTMGEQLRLCSRYRDNSRPAWWTYDNAN
jgi:hypothetical protein